MRVWPVLAVAAGMAGCGRGGFPDREYVAGYRHQSPYELVDDQGRPSGFTIDVANEAARRAGVRLRWAPAPEGPDLALERGSVDLWPLLAIMPERNGRIYTTRPYREGLYALAVRAESGIDKVEQFGSRRLTVAPNWWLRRQAASAFSGAIQTPSTDGDAAMSALCRGQVDGVLIGVNSDIDRLNHPLKDCQDRTIRLLSLGGDTTRAGVGASLRNPGASTVAEHLRDAIDTMIADGTIAGITLKWFGTAGSERGLQARLAEERWWSWILLTGLLAAACLVAIVAALAVRYRRATAEAQAARLEAERANRVKGDFLTTLSHELRTPIIGVLGMIESIVTGPLNPAQREASAVISRSSESLLALIDDMLNFAKLEAGRMSIETKPFELWAAIEESALALEAQTRRKGLALGFHFSKDLPWMVVGDALRLRQVLLNLVSNAVKFTESGSVTVTAAVVGWHGPEARVRIAVRDTGPGIPSAKQHLLFQRFSQVDSSPSRRAGGTGLGLAISKQLLKAMNGTIGVVSKDGQAGAEFWFELPLPCMTDDRPLAVPTPLTLRCRNQEAARQALQQLAAWAPHAAVDISIQDSDGALAIPVRPTAIRAALLGLGAEPVTAIEQPMFGHILLAEDNAVNQKVASALLVKLGLKVDVAADGAAAVARWREGRYDAILMDCTMPGMDGYEATRQIRQLEQGTGKHTPIIALTANALEEARQECLAAGMDDFATKPVRLDTLKPLLAAWLAAKT